MKLITPLSLLLNACLLSLAASSCQDDFGIEPTSGNGEIRFDITTSDNSPSVSSSRSSSDIAAMPCTVTMYNTTTGDSLFMHPQLSTFSEAQTSGAQGSRSSTVATSSMYDGFGVSAYYYNDSWNESHSVTEPNYFIAQTAVKSGSNYALSPARYWPNDGKVLFLAYAPLNDEYYTYYSWIEDPNNVRGSYMHIQVPENAADQKDLLIAYTSEINCKSRPASVPLNFKHVMAGIRFRLSDDMSNYTIKRVTISNIISNGDFIFDLKDATDKSDADNDISAKCSLWALTDGYSSYMDYDALTAEDDTLFFMLPQWIESAPVQVTLQPTDGSLEPYIISGSLTNTMWQMGHIITYNISFNDSGLEITQPATFNYQGQIYSAADNTFSSVNPVTVTAFKRNEADSWTVTYKEDGKAESSTCDWLSYTEETSADNPYSRIVNFKATSTSTLIDIDNNLRNAATLGSQTARYNLAATDGTPSVVYNTANCYIVGAKGYYILPAVYGNAYHKGVLNESYKYGGGTGSNILSTFKNHLGNEIQSAYIADNPGCTPASAALIWQDEPNLVTNVALDATAYNGKAGITFDIGSSIRQGNAVIGVKDSSGNIMWSWHIWVTNMNLDSDDRSIAVTNHDGNVYNVMPVSIGWCSSDTDGDGQYDPVKYYRARKCQVTFTSSSGLSRTITISQTSHVAYPRGNHLYYQWGRKDPFVGTNANWANKTWYDAQGVAQTGSPARIYPDGQNNDRKTTVEALAAGDLIRYPDRWHNPPGTGLDTNTPVSDNQTYTNLWLGYGTSTPSYRTKTVYDPCPAGWEVAPVETFTGFTSDGQNTVEDASQTDKIYYVPRSAIPAGNPSEELMEFYTDSTKLKSITFSQTGYRDWNAMAGIYQFGSESSAALGRGFVWLSGTYDSHDAYDFKYAYGLFAQPNNAFYICDGFAVRPVAYDD